MQYDDGANRTTDSDADDADRSGPQPDPEHAGSDDGGEALAEYSVVEESVVEEPDEQAAATDPRGGSDDVWQGVQSAEGTEAVSEDPVTEDVVQDTHPTNVQPVTPDLGGVQPVDPDLGTGESVGDSSGTSTSEDPELTAAGLDETDTEGSGPGAGDTAAAVDPAETAARTDGDDPLRARWHQAQHLFVDDPSGAVRKAAGLVQEAADRATSATDGGSGTDRGPQHSPDTERLRITMQHYHEAFELLIGISSGDPA